MVIRDGAARVLVRLVGGVEVLDGLAAVRSTLARRRIAHGAPCLGKAGIATLADVLDDTPPRVGAAEVICESEGLLRRAFEATVEEAPQHLAESPWVTNHPPLHLTPRRHGTERDLLQLVVPDKIAGDKDSLRGVNYPRTVLCHFTPSLVSPPCEWAALAAAFSSKSLSKSLVRWCDVRFMNIVV